MKEAKKFSFKLVMLFGFDVFIIQPNFVARDIASKLYNLIMNLLLKLLSIVEVFLIYNYQFFELN